MSSMSMGSGKQQVVQPPQRGIFPLDHFADCKNTMEIYLHCLQQHGDVHYKCRDYSKAYLQCRMDHELMSRENLDNLGFAPNQQVVGATDYDHAKEKAGFVAGKHISKESKWWFQRPGNKGWEG